MKQFRASMSRPVFEDEDQTRIAGFLYTIILTLGAGAILYILIAQTFFISIPRSIVLVVTFAVILLTALYFLTQRGYLTLVSILLISGLWLIQTAAVYIDGGVSSPTFASYVIIIIITSVVFGGQAGVIVAIMSAVAGAGLMIAEARDLLPSPPHPAIAGWATHSMLFVLTAALLALFNRNLKSALDNARQSAQTIRASEEALRESEVKYRTLVERIPAIIYTAAMDEAKTRLYVSPQVERILGYTQAEYLADSELWRELLHPDDRQRILGEAEYFYTTGEPFISEYRTFTRDGRVVWVHDEAVILHDTAGKPQLIQGVRMDITELKQVEEKIKTPLAQLASLRAIDVAIMSTRDLRMIFYILLSQTIAKLKVDAARILLFNSSTRMLEFGAAQGFLSSDIEKAHVKLGEEIAGRAALEGILMDGHRLTKEFFSVNAPVLVNEGFTCFYAVPLISKGKIKGVLEIFEKEHLHHDRGWVDFLNALAGQAAIAIDNVSLFNDLQRSNTDLSLAYETTLEGWSAALDLRDRETEGHTQRVTKLTEQIAKSMGITGKELLHIRRGSLLHDIGKVGVPDRILHKRGPLTNNEWKTMRKHPQFAYDMLSPIAYLHGALDIPYCHHEKWDGSGYPRGLKGEEIPLAARIFAVVDVYDALISDRPYRKGWSKRKALKHIREQTGIHFDPQVVEVFMREMETK
ncbi:MAG: PAS domain-containing protein [Anaerolineae bacterium]|nr:PAS domain-containing protein [Anaerolineae bacterium]MCI0610916.1 PAS domain-containing protein [Anaerolineae bacterium]